MTSCVIDSFLCFHLSYLIIYLGRGVFTSLVTFVSFKFSVVDKMFKKCDTKSNFMFFFFFSIEKKSDWNCVIVNIIDVKHNFNFILNECQVLFFLLQNSKKRLLTFYLSYYFACLSYPFVISFVKTADPIGSKFCVGP